MRSGIANSDILKSYLGLLCLGSQGFCLARALRPVTQHSARETEYTIERVLPLAAKLTASRSGDGDTAISLLRCADSDFDSAKLMCVIGKQATVLERDLAFTIKWNPRTTPMETIAPNGAANTSTTWMPVPEGKRQCLWAASKRGQQMLLPESVLEGWSTTLSNAFMPEQIIAVFECHWSLLDTA